MLTKSPKQPVFPDPTPFEDIVAVSDSITLPLLLEGYAKGFFPWPNEGFEGIPWFHPKKRAVLYFDELKIGATLKKEIRRTRAVFHFTLNKDFAAVLRNCADIPRPDQPGTWITDEILREYQNLHALGYAHSVEAWDENENLVGGIYGVYTGGFFSAESMFYTVPNASKLCLLQLIHVLKEKGEHLVDIQMLTPHMIKLGAREIKRPAFLREYARRKNPSKIHLATDRLFESQNEASRLLLPLD